MIVPYSTRLQNRFPKPALAFGAIFNKLKQQYTNLATDAGIEIGKNLANAEGREFDVLATGYKARLNAVVKDEQKFFTLREEIIQEIVQLQAQAVKNLVPGFNQFEQVNKQASIAAQQFSDVPIATGIDVLTEGIKNLAQNSTAAANQVTGGVKAARQSFLGTIFGFTGIPQLVEQFEFNNQLYSIKGIG